MEKNYNWSIDSLVEIELESDEKFNLVAETLTRFGVQSIKNNKKILNQTCHIIKGKNKKYYVVHFKELFALDGRQHSLTMSDIGRRNKIIKLLQDWNTLKVVEGQEVNYLNSKEMDGITIIRKEDVDDWVLQKKYEMPLKTEHLENFLYNTDF